MTITLRVFSDINFYVFSWFTLVETLLKTRINKMYSSKWKFSSEILKEVGYVYAEFYIWRRKWQPTPVCCLENPMDRGAWWATVHGILKSWTRLKQQSMHICNIKH